MYAYMYVTTVVEHYGFPSQRCKVTELCALYPPPCLLAIGGDNNRFACLSYALVVVLLYYVVLL